MAKKIVKRKNKEEKIDEVEKKISRKHQAEAENRILRNIFIGIIIVVVAIVAIVFFLKSIGSFQYEGVDFQVVKFCDAGPCLVTYNTKLPITYEGKDAEYNFYLRNDPRKLAKDVPFLGNVSLAQNIVINSTSDFNCQGDVGIAMGNLGNLFSISGINAIRDENIPLPYIVVITASVSQADKETCFQLGVRDFLLKPFNMGVLKNILEQI